MQVLQAPLLGANIRRAGEDVQPGDPVLALPAVITTDLRLNEPRYAKLPDIMKAKKKPLDVKNPADYGVEVASNVTLLKVESPAERKGGIKVASVDELIDKLKNEAKVL